MKKRNIGIVTIHSYNFGNRLQNYALQKIIEGYGCRVWTLPMVHSTWKTRIKEWIKVMFYPFYKSKNWAWACFDHKYIRWSRYIHTDKKTDYFFDTFVAGSDQIWNPFFWFNSEREFLTFASPGKRVAYAASLGISRLPDRETEIRFASFWKAFAALSVREEAGASVIQSCTGLKVPVVLDPTMLLPPEQWSKLSAKSKIQLRGKYVVKYFLEEIHPDMEKEIEQYAERIGAEIISIGNENKYGGNFIGPIEFISLLQHSAFVFANSFHAVAFSVIFHREFVALRRHGKEDTGDMNSRIETILGMLSLESRYMESVGQLEQLINRKIDYQKADRIIAAKKEDSLRYLRKALHLV